MADTAIDAADHEPLTGPVLDIGLDQAGTARWPSRPESIEQTPTHWRAARGHGGNRSGGLYRSDADGFQAGVRRACALGATLSLRPGAGQLL